MTDETARQGDNRGVIRPEGDVVATSIPDLRESMRQMIAGGVQEIVLDLSNARMLDSRGIGLLIAAHNSLRKRGGSLSVVHASREILDLLKTMRIHQHMSVSGD